MLFCYINDNYSQDDYGFCNLEVIYIEQNLFSLSRPAKLPKSQTQDASLVAMAASVSTVVDWGGQNEHVDDKDTGTGYSGWTRSIHEVMRYSGSFF